MSIFARECALLSLNGFHDCPLFSPGIDKEGGQSWHQYQRTKHISNKHKGEQHVHYLSPTCFISHTDTEYEIKNFHFRAAPHARQYTPRLAAVLDNR